MVPKLWQVEIHGNVSREVNKQTKLLLKALQKQNLQEAVVLDIENDDLYETGLHRLTDIFKENNR